MLTRAPPKLKLTYVILNNIGVDVGESGAIRMQPPLVLIVRGELSFGVFVVAQEGEDAGSLFHTFS